MILKEAHISLNQLNGILQGQGQNGAQDSALVTLGYHYALKRNDWVFEDLSPLTIKYLLAWHMYSSKMRTIIGMPNPVQVQYVQQLLGLSKPGLASRSNSGLHISRSSVLYPSTSEGQMQVDETSPYEDLFPAHVVNQLIKGSCIDQLKQQLEVLHHDLYNSTWTRPLWSVKASESCGTNTALPTFLDQLYTLALVFAILDLVKGTIAKSCFNREDTVIGDLWLIRLFNLVFPPTGSCNDLSLLSSLQNGSQLKATVHAWISEAIKSSSAGHKKTSITKLVVCLSLEYEIHIPGTSHRHTLPPQNARSPIAGKPLTRLDLFTDKWTQSFLQDPSRRTIQLISVLRHAVEGNRVIDGAVLVHLTEQITREVILSKRTSPSGNSGFSGLIAPASWARSLASHSRNFECVIETESLDLLLQCVESILRVLYSGLPDRWQSNNMDNSKHSLDLLIIRLHWSLALVAVNIHPKCDEIRLIFDIFHQAQPSPRREPSHDTTQLLDDDLVFNFSKISDQESALSALRQTIQHEELVMLWHRGKPITSAKRNMVHRIIEFRDLGHLRSQL
ncbi:hypothetical protein BDV93DRAFT_512448 [Ceratobasidium sp. AG-I]|nr:hypothetical protein BDV93DRAFT_512448 [Ceratobasidium sp. AG-I]